MAKKGASRSNLSLLSLMPVCMGPLAANAMAADAAGNLPKRIRLAAWGINKARGHGKDGAGVTFIVNEHTLKALPTNQIERGFDTIPVDFEHATHKGHPNYQPGPVKTAGMGRVSVVRGEGIFLEVDRYTPTGLEYAASYPDVSGVFWTNAKGEVILVSSVALTMQGAVEGAEFVEWPARALAASVAAAINKGALLTSKPGKAPEADMQGTAEEVLVALGRELLGYDDEATADDVQNGLAGLLKAKRAAESADEEEEDEEEEPEFSRPENTNQTQKLTPEMSDKLEAKVDALAKSVETLMEQFKPVAASVLELKQRDDTASHNAAVEAVISASIAAGKVVPATVKAQDAKGRYVMSAEGAKEIMDCIAATVSVDGKQTAKPDASKAGEISADEREVMIACGITEEAWKAGAKHIQRAFEPAGNTALVS